MKNSTTWTILVVVIVLLVAFLIVVFIPGKPAIAPGTASSTPTTERQAVNYSCDSGSLSAVYGTSAVSLTLSDGRTLSLPQTMSADGAKYEGQDGTGIDVVFWNKGNNAFVTENGNTTYNNCVAGNTTSNGNGTSSFSDASGLFSFNYPSSFSVSGGDGSYTQDWRAGATTSGMILAAVNVARSFQPNTNFVGAKFTVGVSSDPSDVKNCSSEGGAASGASGQVTINGVTFTKLTLSDAAAGNDYQTTSYRTVKDNECYAIEYTIHSGNINNYPANAGVSQFDQAKVQSSLDSIAESFRFLQ